MRRLIVIVALVALPGIARAEEARDSDGCPQYASDPLLGPFYGYLPMSKYIAFEGKYVSRAKSVVLGLYNLASGPKGSLDVSVFVPGPPGTFDTAKKIRLFELGQGQRLGHFETEGGCIFNIGLDGSKGSETATLTQRGTCGDLLGQLDVSGTYKMWEPSTGRQ